MTIKQQYIEQKLISMQRIANFSHKKSKEGEEFAWTVGVSASLFSLLKQAIEKGDDKAITSHLSSFKRTFRQALAFYKFYKKAESV